MRATIDFLLNDWLESGSLFARDRFAEHTNETFSAVLNTCERIADERFAPFNRQVDVEEPYLEDGIVRLPVAAYESAQAYVESGMLAAAQDYELGGMQLPCSIQMAASALFWKAGVGLGGAPMLTTANANLLMVHGAPLQQEVFARQEFQGNWFGTMCLSEPAAGSSLSDIVTQAIPDGTDFAADPLGPRYRLFGNKMWISNGDHELSENIVHLVLAKVPDEDGKAVAGTKGISLFIVPKKLVDATGSLTGVRNDVVVAGLNHKLGCRGIPNTLLNFGEGRYPVGGKAGAIGYRVGQVGEGLSCMFHMMNEARIAVGMSAAAIGYSGYETSLRYARERLQGRLPGAAGKDPSTTQVRIVEHADVKRMLLAQKAYVQGGLALALYCARLVDDERTAEGESAYEAKQLLDILTPIVKSWPSQWCLEANNLAIQVLGGYGYTRDFSVEQCWRDNRLNMIHEGTHGIQALDLLGRKVLMQGGRVFNLLLARMRKTVSKAANHKSIATFATQLDHAVAKLEASTHQAWGSQEAAETLANATPYLEAFGHTVVAWIWLDVAITVTGMLGAETSEKDEPMLLGLLQATRYFYDFELPRVDAWINPVAARNPVCREMKDEWF